MRDTTQIPQPIPPAPELVSGYPALPEKLAKAFPEFLRYHQENEKRYKRLREAFSEAQTQLSLPVTLVKVAQDSLTRSQQKLQADLATTNATASSLASTVAAIDNDLDTVNGTLSTHAGRLTTLESTVGGGLPDLTAVWSAITTEENTRASADTTLQGNIDTAASRVTTLESAVNNATTGLANAHSRITTEEGTRASAVTGLNNGLTAVSGRVTTLESQVQGATTGLIARVQTIENTYATDAEASAAASSAITAALGGGGAINSAISSSVSAASSAQATINGRLAGKYTLAVTAGNVVTGMNITSVSDNGTNTSEVAFQATAFKVFNGATAEAPFQVIGNAVKISGALIVNGSITTGQLNFTPVQAGNVVASINASAEGVRISGNKLVIDGNVSFANSYDPTTKLAAGSAAADVNANATTISGGKITANTISADKLSSTLSFTQELVIATGGRLHSANYAAGSAGFNVDTNGNAEFNSVTLRNPVIYNTLGTPGVSPASCSFASSLTLSANGPVGSTVRYSTTGTVTGSSPVWPGGGLTITSSTTLRLRAFSGTLQSDEVSFTYTKTTVSNKVATPAITGTGYSPLTASASCATPGATIYLSLYTGGSWGAWVGWYNVNLYPGEGVRAYAALSGWDSSDVYQLGPL